MSPFLMLYWLLCLSLYPLSGLIADVCCGRLRTVAVSSCCILAFVLLLCIIETIVLTAGLKYYNFPFDNFEGTVACLLCIISLIFFIVGLAGYQANFIQFGLDQPYLKLPVIIWDSLYTTQHGALIWVLSH